MRTIGEGVGYTVPRRRSIRVPSLDEIERAYSARGLRTDDIRREHGPTRFGETLLDYLQHRATLLNDYVEPRLMDAERARTEFERLRASLTPTCPLPMNKQRGEKKAPAYLTCIVNMFG